MQGLHLTIFSIPNFYLCSNTRISKTQGPPLVSTRTKPKAPNWSAHSLRTTMTTIKGPGSTRRTITTMVSKTFNQVKVILTPYNRGKAQ